MYYYKFIFYLIVKLAKRLKPDIKNEQLEDGAYWSLNFINFFYVLHIVQIFLNSKDYSGIGGLKYIIIMIWVILVIVNYFIFIRKNQWETMFSEFEKLTLKDKKYKTIMTVSFLAVTGIGLFTCFILKATVFFHK